MLSRRDFLTVLGSGLLVACGGASTPAMPPEMRERTDRAIPVLEPEVKAAIERKGWHFNHLDEDQLELIEFFVMKKLGRTSFYAQMKASNLATSARTNFLPEHQIATLENDLYDFVTLPKRRIIVVYSAIDLKMQRKTIEPTIEMVRTWLPRVDEYLGGIYPDNFLHIQLGMDEDVSGGLGLFEGINTTIGPNIWLTTSSEAVPEVFCHEAVHIYNTRFAQPHWAVEAFPGIVDLELTKKALYVKFADGGQIDLEVAGAPVAVINAQIGNAVLMLAAMRRSMGTSFGEALRQIITEDKLRFPYQGKIMGKEILRIFKQAAPDKAALDAIYVKWVSGYLPSSIN